MVAGHVAVTVTLVAVWYGEAVVQAPPSPAIPTAPSAPVCASAAPAASRDSVASAAPLSLGAPSGGPLVDAPSGGPLVDAPSGGPPVAPVPIAASDVVLPLLFDEPPSTVAPRPFATFATMAYGDRCIVVPPIVCWYGSRSGGDVACHALSTTVLTAKSVGARPPSSAVAYANTIETGCANRVPVGPISYAWPIAPVMGGLIGVIERRMS